MSRSNDMQTPAQAHRPAQATGPEQGATLPADALQGPACQGDVAGIAVDLFRCAADRLTDSDLLTLMDRAEDAAHLMANIRTVCTGVACLVANDGDGTAGARVGNFRDAEEVAPLLWSIAALASQAEALARLAIAAEGERHLRAHRGGRAS